MALAVASPSPEMRLKTCTGAKLRSTPVKKNLYFAALLRRLSLTELTDEADALAHDLLPGLLELSLAHVVLVHANAQVFGVQSGVLGEGVLQPAGDAHGADQVGVKPRVVGKGFL